MRVVGLIAPLLFGSASFAADLPAVEEGDFTIRDFKFHSGEALAELRLHYYTVGNPSAPNVALIMHGTGGSGQNFLSQQFAGELFEAGQPRDASNFFIVMPDAIGNGKSSKPSDGLHAKFPKYCYHDMVTADYRLLTEHVGITHARLVMGTSMGAMHTWMWGEMYPDFMDALMPLASAPVQIAGRNRLLRDMIIESIRSDPEYKGGEYDHPLHGIQAAQYVERIMTSSPLQMQNQYPTRDTADDYLGLDRVAPYQKLNRSASWNCRFVPEPTVLDTVWVSAPKPPPAAAEVYAWPG
jgi:homoserine O-acetyltransferase